MAVCVQIRLHNQSQFSSGLPNQTPYFLDIEELRLPVLGGAAVLLLRIFQLLCWPLPGCCRKLLMEDCLQKKAQMQSAQKVTVVTNTCFSSALC